MQPNNACVVHTVSLDCEDHHSNSSVSEESSCDEYAYTAVSYTFDALSVTDGTDVWFGDTGATEDMTDQRHWFSTYNCVPEGSLYVSVADNGKLPVHGTGTIRILRKLDGVDKEGYLEDVLYVPQLKQNLFSIGIAIDKGLLFISSGSTCEFRLHARTGSKVLEGIRHGKLFLISFTVILRVSTATVAASQANITTSSAFNGNFPPDSSKGS